MSLPEPYFETENGVLYHGDCLEIMPHLEPVDLVLTDPPYNVLSESWDKFKGMEFSIFTAKWILSVVDKCNTLYSFSPTTSDEIQSFCKLFFKNTRRLVWDKGSSSCGDDKFWYVYEDIYKCDNKKNMVFVKPKDNKFGILLKERRKQSGLSLGAVDILSRGKKTGLCYRWEEGCSLPSDEAIEKISGHLNLTSEDLAILKCAREQKNKTVALMLESNARSGATHQDVLRFPVMKASIHPTEKPIGLIITLIDGLVEQPRTVLDPFLGSGTTAVACERLGRKWIGIELEEKYCEIAAKRIEAENRQLKIPGC